MRLTIGLFFAISICCSARADPVAIPTYDTAKTCRTLADYTYAATLGDVDVRHEIEVCMKREGDQRGSVDALWPLASDADRAECLRLAEDRYGYLARCLAVSRSVRASR